MPSGRAGTGDWNGVPQTPAEWCEPRGSLALGAALAALRVRLIPCQISELK